MEKATLSLIILFFLSTTQAFGANKKFSNPNFLYHKRGSQSALFPAHTEFSKYTYKDPLYELSGFIEATSNPDKKKQLGTINGSYNYYLSYRGQTENAQIKTTKEWFEGKLKELKPYTGTFYEKTIGELKAEIAESEKSGTRKPFNSKAHFEILYGTTIQSLMNNPKNNGAVFQSASDVSCLEGRATSPKSLLLDMQQKGQCVQGETSAFLFFWGTFYRKYLYLFEHGKPFINLLDKVDGFEIANNRYHIKKYPQTFNEQDYENFKIGYQYNTTVAYEADPEYKKMKYPFLRKKAEEMKVDNAISFALAYPNPKNNLQVQHAKQILKSTYPATILAAYWAGRQVVYLTLIGGGVYGNKIEWILDAIQETFPFIAEKRMHVYLVIPSTRQEIEKNYKFQIKNNDDPLRLTIEWLKNYS